MIELWVLAQLLVIQPVVETLHNQCSKVGEARRGVRLDLRVLYQTIHTVLNIRKIVRVELLIRSQRGSVQMFNADVVLPGDSDQRIHQSAGLGGLASHQLDNLGGRDTKEVKRKVVQRCRAQKIG